MATALYRRYRPEAFSEMIGQAHVTEPLMTALRTGRIGHAYLFSGPRGCGKTTSARILARCLNCAEGPTDTPCGSCPSCVELSRDGGGSLDVVEIDAASHGGVDDARELRERAVFAPARDRFKIFIIDEAHMVTSGGFNALLKIVEEPPPHVKFVFATTEPEKVIGTIRSRTHHYPFRLIAPGTLVDYAQQLVDSEGVQVEPGVLPLVVRAGGGSVRDSLSILDQLIAGSEGDQVTLDRATGLLGYTSAELLDEVVAAFGARDPGAAFAAADRVVQTGQDPRRFVEDLLERLRDLIVVSATSVQGASAVFRGVPVDRLQRMYEQAQAFGPGELSRIADTVSGALDRMTGATAPRLHLELMIARAIAAQAGGPVAGTPQGAPAVSHPAPSAPGGAAASPAQPARAAEAGRGSVQAPPAPTPAAAGSAPAVPAPSAVPPVAASAPAPPEVDIVSTLRSARDFLRSDGAGAGASAPPAAAARPAAPRAEAPAPAAEPASAEPEQREQPPASETPASAQSAAGAEPAAAVEPVGLDELREVWPQLLEEILEEDRDAWNAVRGVQPLAIDGDVLTIGLASRTDLEAFKSSGARPLREAIAAAVGIQVKYVPKPMPPGLQSAAEREPAADPEPSPPADSNAGGPSGADAPASVVSALDAPAVAQEAPTPDSAADPEPVADPRPAVADSTATADPAPERIGEFGDPGFRPDRDPDADPAYDPDLRDDEEDPYAGGPFDAGPFDAGPSGAAADDGGPAGAEEAGDPFAGAASGESASGEPVPVPASGSGSGSASGSETDPAPEAALAPVPAPSGLVTHAPAVPPSGNRYGESVVRELLGARFIEERPLPQSGE